MGEREGLPCTLTNTVNALGEFGFENTRGKNAAAIRGGSCVSHYDYATENPRLNCGPRCEMLDQEKEMKPVKDSGRLD